MAQQIKITQTSNTDMNIGVHKNCHISTNNSDTKQITMAQQTAVDWLFEQIGNGNITSEKTDCGYLITINNDCYKKAKQMEKEQIIEAYKFGLQDEYVIGSEQYYNETYDK